MTFIVGVQVYQQTGPDGDSPLVVAESSICAVNLEKGEQLTLDEMAHLALQIHVDGDKKALGKVVKIIDNAITDFSPPPGKTIQIRKTDGTKITWEGRKD